MTYKEIVNKVAEKLNLPKGVVDRTYRAYWKAVMEHISSLPLMEDLSDEEFLKLQPNVNIPSIGKLYVTLDRYKYVKEKHREYMRKMMEEMKDFDD